MVSSRDPRKAQYALPLQPARPFTAAMDPLGLPNAQSRPIIRPLNYFGDFAEPQGSFVQAHLSPQWPSQFVQPGIVIADVSPFPTNATTTTNATTSNTTTGQGFGSAFSNSYPFAMSDASFFPNPSLGASAAFAAAGQHDWQAEHSIQDVILANSNLNIDLGLVPFPASIGIPEPQDSMCPVPRPLNPAAPFETSHQQEIIPLLTGLTQLPTELLNYSFGPLTHPSGDLVMQPETDGSICANDPSLICHLPIVPAVNSSNDVIRAQGPTNGVITQPTADALKLERVRAHRKIIKNVNKPPKGKKRGPLADDDREAAKLTRKIKACTRCHLFKIRCFSDDNDPHGSCLTCLQSKPNILWLPCTRLKITDIKQLFRLGPSDEFIKARRWLNETWDDKSTWQSQEERDIILTQGYGRTTMRLKVKKFIPRHDDSLVRPHEYQNLYYTPYAIASRLGAINELQRHIDDATKLYVDAFSKKSPILKRTFMMILSSINEPEGITDVNLLKDTLRLWVATRFIEKPWEVPAAQTLDRARDHGDQVPDSVPISPVMDHQLDQIIIKRILKPLKGEIEKRLQRLVVANKRENWFIIFLCTFLMLHNYEAAIAHDRNFAIENRPQSYFSDEKLIKEYHAGAKTLLIHFKYCCKGHVPFQAYNTNEKSDEFAPFTENQKEYIKDMAHYIAQQADELKNLETSVSYDAELHLVSRLFTGNLDSQDPFKNLL